LNETGASTFWELLEQQALPKETRGYVPTFFATLLIARDPASYGFKIGDPEEWNDRKVEVEGPVSLRYLAEVAGVDEKVIKELNPGLRRDMVPPGRATVRVPPAAAAAIAERGARLRQDDAYIAVASFTLRSGDSVERLATALGTKAETILAMNQTSRTPRPGDEILLPVKARELGTLLAHHDNAEVYYAVEKGDTLYSIARRHGLTSDELRELNELAKETPLRPGQKLRVNAGRAVTAGGM
jgi:membrane-bound lytic murein transglycosylase D